MVLLIFNYFSYWWTKERRVKVLHSSLLNGKREVIDGQAKAIISWYWGGANLCLVVEIGPTQERRPRKERIGREEKACQQHHDCARLVERHQDYHQVEWVRCGTWWEIYVEGLMAEGGRVRERNGKIKVRPQQRKEYGIDQTQWSWAVTKRRVTQKW